MPLHGPAGTLWKQTWATFYFASDGKLTRRLKRFTPDDATNTIDTMGEVWEIGSGVSAAAILGAAGERD